MVSEYPPKCCTYSANSVVKCLVPRETLPIRRTFSIHPTTNLQLLFFVLFEATYVGCVCI